MSQPSRQTEAELDALLERRDSATSDAERAALDTEIREVFEETHAIFALDMNRFSSQVLRHGILHFLSQIHEMRRIAMPLITEHGGTLVKYVADDLLALFPTVSAAIAASEAIIEATRRPEVDFSVAIGIGHGTLLHIPGHDIWGNEVNLTFKLGEDTARENEILLTQSAHATLQESERAGFEEMRISISGLEVRAYTNM